MVNARMQEVARAITAGYGLPNHIDNVVSIIANGHQFNASTYQQNNTLVVSINASVPILIRTLFDRLLAQPSVFPELPIDTPDAISYSPLFMIDPTSTDQLERINIHISEDRYSASRILGDLCVTYVFLHEYGHLLCGHTQAIRNISEETGLLELFELNQPPNKDYIELRQYWEFQADSVAAGLLVQYLDDIVSQSQAHQTWIFDITGCEQNDQKGLATHVCAIAIAALNVLFLYTDQCTFQIKVEKYHPPTQTRLFCLRDVLCSQMAQRWQLDPNDIVATYFDYYLDSFHDGLASIGINVDAINEEYMEGCYNIFRTLKYSNDRLRHVSEPWSWLNAKEWGNPRENKGHTHDRE